MEYVNDKLSKLRELYDERKQISLDMEKRVSDLAQKMETVNDSIADVESEVLKYSEEKDIELSRGSEITVKKGIGRREITAKIGDIKEEYKPIVVKTVVQLIGVMELDRLKKDRQDIDWDAVEANLKIKKKSVWKITDNSGGFA
jgi:hypothetical protein